MAVQRANVAGGATANPLANGESSAATRRPSTAPTAAASALSPPTSPTYNAHAAQFNPRLILSQIVSLQSFHYVVLGLIFQVNRLLFGTSITMDRIFTARYLDIWSAAGWVDNAAVLMSSFVGSLLLALIVEKSKKCLDFSVTLFIIHVILCSMYGGFPATWDWWIVHVLGMISMIVLGEYFCSKRELSDIPLLVL
ncbi:hypothetical protein ACHAXT_009197 [Thalassiosira profunda]